MIRLSGAEPDSIPIAFTQLRPGDKLNEILWEDGALVTPTAQPNIYKVKEPPCPGASRIGEVIGRIEDAVARGDRRLLLDVLSQCLPTSALAGTLSHHADLNTDSVVH